MNNKDIFTIGYTAFPVEDFIDVLIKHNVSCVIDVRSSPFSKFYESYNKNNIQILLKEKGILYRNYVNEFGARQEDENYYFDDGCLDFSKFIASQQFQDGINKVSEGMKLGYTFCLMCAETDPIDCHRSIMVGRGFKQKGFGVKHILKNKSIESQDDIEKKLLDIYFENRNQLTLSLEIQDDSKLIEECYILKNKEIGFRKDGE